MIDLAVGARDQLEPPDLSEAEVGVGAERNQGQINLFDAAGDFARRGLWVGAAVMVLGLAYLGLGLGQGLVRSAIWNFWQTSSASPLIKNLTYFVFIFSFAMLRLWVTLLILTYGLKQSYVRAGRGFV